MTNEANLTGPDVAVVCGHFNFAGFRAPRRNLHRFVRYIHSLGVPCYGVELFMKGQKPITAGYPNWQQWQAGREHVLWQKEGLWNAAERLVPKRYRKLIFLDADVWCGDPRWMRKISAALDELAVVHPMGDVFAPDAEGVCKEANFKSVVKQGLEPPMKAHPGYGWAVRRDLFDQGIRFFDATVAGNGDWFMAYALLAEKPMQTLIAHNTHADPVGPPWVLDGYEVWLQQFLPWLGGRQRVGFVDVPLFHEYHGTKRNRQYTTRRKMMHGLTGAELVRDERGLWTWSKDANPLRMECFWNYFVNRKEDV